MWGAPVVLRFDEAKWNFVMATVNINLAGVCDWPVEVKGSIGAMQNDYVTICSDCRRNQEGSRCY